MKRRRKGGTLQHLSFPMAKSQADIRSLADGQVIETLDQESGISAVRVREWQARIDRIRNGEIYTEACRLLQSRSRGREDHSTGKHF